MAGQYGARGRDLACVGGEVRLRRSRIHSLEVGVWDRVAPVEELDLLAGQPPAEGPTGRSTSGAVQVMPST